MMHEKLLKTKGLDLLVGERGVWSWIGRRGVLSGWGIVNGWVSERCKVDGKLGV